jgi:hypothetical protein
VDDDDLEFESRYVGLPNIKYDYALADQTLDNLPSLLSKHGLDVDNVRLIVSDMGIKNIHEMDREHVFNNMILDLYDAYTRTMMSVPLVMKMYTPSPMEYTANPGLIDLLDTVYLTKPQASGPLNREIYVVQGIEIDEAVSLESLYRKQIDEITQFTGVKIPVERSVSGLRKYTDWAIGMNMLADVGTSYSLPHFSAYLGINFPSNEGLNWDPSSRDASVWKVLVTKSSILNAEDGYYCKYHFRRSKIGWNDD